MQLSLIVFIQLRNKKIPHEISCGIYICVVLFYYFTIPNSLILVSPVDVFCWNRFSFPSRVMKL